MNPTPGARRHLVERAAEMLERDMATARQEGSRQQEAPATPRLDEAAQAPDRPPAGHVFAVPESVPPQAPPPAAEHRAEPQRGEPQRTEPLWPAAEAPPAGNRRVAPQVPLAAFQAAGLVQPPEGQGRCRTLEEIAMVQHQVLRVMAEAPPEEAPRSHIVLIGSALPREGRTFIALNLAVSIATSGARSVVLVDADGGATSLTRRMALDGRPGLCDMIAEPEGPAARFALTTAVDRLLVLPHGARRDAEGEPPPAATSAAAILRLAQALPNHVIILDPPPCLSTSDCTALATAAGQVVLVVDAQRTARDEVEAALDGLDACPVLQLLLNRAQLSTGSSFGAHYETTHAR